MNHHSSDNRCSSEFMIPFVNNWLGICNNKSYLKEDLPKSIFSSFSAVWNQQHRWLQKQQKPYPERWKLIQIAEQQSYQCFTTTATTHRRKNWFKTTTTECTKKNWLTPHSSSSTGSPSWIPRFHSLLWNTTFTHSNTSSSTQRFASNKNHIWGNTYSFKWKWYLM